MRDFQSVNSATLPVADLLATMGRESGHRHLRSPTDVVHAAGVQI